MVADDKDSRGRNLRTAFASVMIDSEETTIKKNRHRSKGRKGFMGKDNFKKLDLASAVPGGSSTPTTPHSPNTHKRDSPDSPTSLSSFSGEVVRVLEAGEGEISKLAGVDEEEGAVGACGDKGEGHESPRRHPMYVTSLELGSLLTAENC